MIQHPHRKIRVTSVLPSFAGGGAERVVLTMLRYLDRTHYAPSLVVLSGEGPLREAVPNDLPVTDLARPRLRYAWFRLGQALRATNPDIVLPTISHINLATLMQRGKLASHTRIIARESNTPSASLGATRWPRLYHRLYRHYCRRADTILCPSRLVSDEFESAFRIAPDRLFVLPHPVDVETIRVAAQSPQREPGAGLRVVAAGRLTHQKGFDRLIEILTRLPADTHLTLLGDGEDRASLIAQADRLGLRDRIAFKGFVREPWPYFAGADAFLLPSRWEGMPNAALEALAVGAPVIARSEAGGVGEIESAALTVVDSNDAFAEAMARTPLSATVELRESLLPDRFTLRAVMHEFEALLSRIATNSGERENAP